ncbi:MAG: hypothetical protein H6660_06295 [Ardenticatenaceae bacterium]|nr:hypothetical protein [Ardenticatenaceae bacterium]
MAKREFHYRWVWELQASPQALWPLVADTNRFNMDTLLPSVTQAAAIGNGRRLLRFRLPVVTLSWEEEPFNWIYPSQFGVVRRYRNGPIRQMIVQVDLEPLPDGGTRATYQVWAEPRNILGLLGIPVVIGLISAHQFARVFAAYDALAVQNKLPVSQPLFPRFVPGGRDRLSQIRQQLLADGVNAHLLAQLVALVADGDQVTLSRLRPYQLADYWAADRREVLELFLLATRAGMLDFQWELICPMCRGAEHKAEHLADIEANVHCSSCNIDFAVNFDRSVELTFRPNPAIRKVEATDYCVAGPQTTPHIIVQQLLPPHGSQKVQPVLEAGQYRLRASALPGNQLLQVAAGGESMAILHAVQDWSVQVPQLNTMPTLQFANETDEEQLLILERVSWSDQAATAAEVTALQRFRDLFSYEALRPDTQISVGRLTIMFTDLRDSTRMYREIGDAPAFGLVLDHFDVLRQAIDMYEGAIVKTIGDAVMAVFPRSLSALQAILQAQQILADPPGEQRPLLLKAAIHTGPAIAVNLNERLDYFGTTINIASRLEKFAQGGDVILSQAVYADPEIGRFLADTPSLSAYSFSERLKGFDEDRFDLWRIEMK